MSRRYRRSRRWSMNKTIHRYGIGLLMIGLVFAVVGGLGTIVTVIPSTELILSDPDPNVTGDEVKVGSDFIIQLIVFLAGAIALLSALNKFGVRL